MIYDVARRFRKELLRGDDDARRRIRQLYILVKPRIRALLDSVLADIQAAERAGIKFSPSWLYKQERYQQAIIQLEAEIARFTQDSAGVVANSQNVARGLATGHTAAYMTELGGSFVRFNPAVVESILGLTANGSPLEKVFESFGGEAKKIFTRELVFGTMAGDNPRVVARRVMKSVEVVRWKAERITRTEMLRAYRMTSQEAFRRSDIVNGWVWLSGLGTRTCPVCWAMHGTVHSNDEEFASHPNCRCTAVPITRDSPNLLTGTERFRELDAASQKKILGKKKFEAYENGQLDLPDLVRKGRDKEWGNYRAERSAKSLGI